MSTDPYLDKTMRPLPTHVPVAGPLDKQELIDLLREMSLNFANDARRIGAPDSDIRACYALRSLACDQAARLLTENSVKYPTWAFSCMVDALNGAACHMSPEDPCYTTGHCITEYCGPCFARTWAKTYPEGT